MENTKRLTCPEHPEFDPSDEDMFLLGLKYQCCPTCTGHYYATMPAGHFADEISTYPGVSEDAEMRIGSSSPVQFGLMRQSLLWHLEHSPEAMLFVDEENQTAYLIGLTPKEAELIKADCLVL
jgi:hypothetical protein